MAPEHLFMAKLKTITMALRMANLSMAEILIRKWILTINPVIPSTLELKPGDWLFLCANATDRSQSMKKFTIYKRSIKQQSGLGVYEIDK